MGKRADKKYQRKGSVFYMTSEEATLSRMPKYNAYACGTGAHGKKKYDRRKVERNLKEVLGL